MEQEYSQNNRNPGGQQSARGMTYNVDIALCIDATGSMEDTAGSQMKLINMVKQNAVHFYEDLGRVLAEKSKKVQRLRVRIVAFRDYLADGEDAMLVTDFFNLPEEAQRFKDCVDSITAKGGGDIPEDGLEALSYALKSKWTKEGAKKRHIIVLWTDAPTHPLGYGSGSPYYPNGMPRTIGELSDWWDDPEIIEKNARRLVLYAPDEGGWKYISDNWQQVLHVPSQAGNGLAENTYEEILNTIANSVS